MKHEHVSVKRRKAVNVSIDPNIVADARAMGINLSQVCERGLRSEIATARNEQWLRDNLDALKSWNTWIEENGLPLEEFRQF